MVPVTTFFVLIAWTKANYYILLSFVGLLRHRHGTRRGWGLHVLETQHEVPSCRHDSWLAAATTAASLLVLHVLETLHELPSCRHDSCLLVGLLPPGHLLPCWSNDTKPANELSLWQLRLGHIQPRQQLHDWSAAIITAASWLYSTMASCRPENYWQASQLSPRTAAS